MQYHITLDFNSKNKTVTSLLTSKEGKVIELKTSPNKPTGFTPVGNETQGFDMYKYASANLYLESFQYINEFGDYSTVHLYDHSGVYLLDMHSSPLVNSILKAELSSGANHHYEIDFIA